VPRPFNFHEGVLLMELVTDAAGNAAPRLNDVELTPELAVQLHEQLVREVVRMLAAGIVHGDLSEYNILLGADGPVIIDLPQAVDASKNPNARKLLLRDVENLHRFLAQWVPGARIRRYAEEMWDLYQQGSLTPETQLVGDYVASTARADTRSVLGHIDDAEYDERQRREARGLPPVAPSRRKRPQAASASPAARRQSTNSAHDTQSAHSAQSSQSAHPSHSAQSATRRGTGAPDRAPRLASPTDPSPKESKGLPSRRRRRR